MEGRRRARARRKIRKIRRIRSASVPLFAKEHARTSDVCDFSRRTSSTTSLLPLAEAAMRSSSAALEATSITAPPSASLLSPSALLARTRPRRARTPVARGLRWLAERRCGGCLSDADATTSDERRSIVFAALQGWWELRFVARQKV